MRGIILDKHGRPEASAASRAALDALQGRQTLVSWHDGLPPEIHEALRLSAEHAGPFEPRMSAQSWEETIVTSQADGTANTTGGAASAIPTPAKITLPNNYFYIGRVLKISATGRISSVITTPGTARYDVRVGAVVAFDGLGILLDSVAAHSNVGWKLEIILTCRAIGSGTATNLMGQGMWTCEDILGVPATAPKGVLSAMLPWNSAPAVGTGFDNTAANTLDLFFTQTAATGSHTVHQYLVESLN